MLTDFGRKSFVTWTTGLKERIQEAEKENQMRKYRGLTKDGKWVYGYYIKSGMGYHYIYIGKEGNPIWDIDGCYIKVIPETVGQQVGLKDKKDKEYYFDDITRWNNKLWIIVWSITLSSIELQPLDNYIERQADPEIKRLYGTSFGIGQAHCSAYIGNIHTTPELLEQDNDPTNPR